MVTSRRARGLETALRGVERRAVRRKRNLLAALLLVLLALALEGHGLLDRFALNRALARGDVATVAQRESPHGLLARAFRAHEDGRGEAALTAYGLVPADAPEAVLDVQRFNLANLFLERAVALERAEEVQLATSLVELAKENYRNLLAGDPAHWDARYNLSRALQMLPDVAAVDFEDEVNPERSPRAPQAAQAYERLP